MKSKNPSRLFERWWIKNNYNGPSFHEAYCVGYWAGVAAELSKKKKRYKSVTAMVNDLSGPKFKKLWKGRKRAAK